MHDPYEFAGIYKIIHIQDYLRFIGLSKHLKIGLSLPSSKM